MKFWNLYCVGGLWEVASGERDVPSRKRLNSVMQMVCPNFFPWNQYTKSSSLIWGKIFYERRRKWNIKSITRLPIRIRTLCFLRRNKFFKYSQLDSELGQICVKSRKAQFCANLTKKLSNVKLISSRNHRKTRLFQIILQIYPNLYLKFSSFTAKNNYIFILKQKFIEKCWKFDVMWNYSAKSK